MQVHKQGRAGTAAQQRRLQLGQKPCGVGEKEGGLFMSIL